MPSSRRMMAADVRLVAGPANRNTRTVPGLIPIMSMEAECSEPLPVDAHASIFGDTTFLFKYFINPECTGYDFKPRLVSVSLKERVERLRRCDATVSFGKSKIDPLFRVPVEEIVSATYLEGDMELPPGQVLAETEEEAFTPYAFFRLK